MCPTNAGPNHQPLTLTLTLPLNDLCPSSSPYLELSFQQQREALGNEAWLYSMVELARAKEDLQWGFDETSIDGAPTLNLWVLVPNGALAPRIINIQWAGKPSPYLVCPHPWARH